MSPKLRPILPLLLLTFAACGGGREESAPAGSSSTATEAPTASSPLGPISSREEAVPSPPAGSQANLDFTLPPGWKSEPASGMSMAQASIPDTNGLGQLKVFYFGPGGGGDVESNIQRWIGQLEVEQGTQPARQMFETANGFRVTCVDITGTLLPSTMGTGPMSAIPDARLLGAVVEGPGGPWFFKATGPKDVLGAQREQFLAMLRSVRLKQG